MPNANQNIRIIELGVQQTAHINERDLQLAVAALAQEGARARVGTGAVTDLTDSSTGTPGSGNALAAVVTPTVVAQDGVALLAPKAGFDTAIGLIEDGNRELAVKANEIIALIAVGSATAADLTLGAATDDILAATATALTGVTAADVGVEDTTGILEINKARNNQASIAAAVNWIRVAQGLAPITDGSGGIFSRTNASYPTDDAAATAAAAPATENSLDEVTTEAALGTLVDNMASLAAALTEANAPAIGPFVVATNSPRFRFVAADITP
jgi:hypothetical protein